MFARTPQWLPQASVLAVLLLPATALAQFEYGVDFNTFTFTITKYTGTDHTVVIPDSYVGVAVTGIESYAFDACSNMTNVTIPEGITWLGERAFNGCTGLTGLTIPASVTNIGIVAFMGCRNVSAYTVDAGNANYCNSADGVLFDKIKTRLVQFPQAKTGSYVIPGTVTLIEDGAFSYSKVTSVSIPASVSVIVDGAFDISIGLTTIIVDSGNPAYSSLDGVLFNKSRTMLKTCPMAKSGTYAIPGSVTTIGDFGFLLCTGLTGVTIPASVTGIGAYAFNYCTRLPFINIPANVISVGDNAFDSCYALKSAVFTGNAPSLGSSVFASAAAGFSVYFFNDKSGFATPPWKDYQTVNMGTPSKVAPWLVNNGFAFNADLYSDPNGDGVNLLMAYALALDPKRNLSPWMPKPVLADNQMQLAFYAGNPDVTYKVEFSTDLQTWTTTGVTLSAPNGNNFRTASIPATDTHRFLRLSVAVP